MGKTESAVVFKAKGEIADVVSHSIRLEKKLKSISLYVRNQGQAYIFNSTILTIGYIQYIHSNQPKLIFIMRKINQ